MALLWVTLTGITWCVSFRACVCVGERDSCQTHVVTYWCSTDDICPTQWQQWSVCWQELSWNPGIHESGTHQSHRASIWGGTQKKKKKHYCCLLIPCLISLEWSGSSMKELEAGHCLTIAIKRGILCIWPICKPRTFPQTPIRDSKSGAFPYHWTGFRGVPYFFE